MRIRQLFGLSCVALAAAVSPAHAITFNTFVSSSDLNAVLGNNATIGFAYAGDKFVGSVYFGANNNQLYSTDLNGANVAKFGTPVASFSGEVYVSSSLGLGGYGPRDVYAGSEGVGSIYRFANDGSSQGLFASGLSSGVRSIAFDPYGLYGNNMIVATHNGDIYKISNTGVPTLLASIGADTEGLSFAPQAFGPYAAGTLFVASEGLGAFLAVSPAGTVTTVVSGIAVPEMVSFVPLNLGSSGNPVEGFYAASYPSNIQKAAASDFAPYIGDAIITGEGTGQVLDIRWDAGSSSFVTTNVASFPGQAEDGIFVTADVITPTPSVPEPETWALMLGGLAGLVALKRKRQPRA